MRPSIVLYLLDHIGQSLEKLPGVGVGLGNERSGVLLNHLPRDSGCFGLTTRRAVHESRQPRALRRADVGSQVNGLTGEDICDRLVVAVGDFIRFLNREAAGGCGHVPLEGAVDPLEGREGAVTIRRESNIRSGPGKTDDGDAIGRPDSGLDECFGGPPRDLFVARRDVVLVEHQQVQMPAWSALITGDFR